MMNFILDFMSFWSIEDAKTKFAIYGWVIHIWIQPNLVADVKISFNSAFLTTGIILGN